jgi:hypothetical protein
MATFVIPAQAGIQMLSQPLDSGCPPQFIPHLMRGGHDSYEEHIKKFFRKKPRF